MPSQTRQLSVVTELSPGALTLVGAHRSRSAVRALLAPTRSRGRELHADPVSTASSAGRRPSASAEGASSTASSRGSAKVAGTSAGVSYRAELVPHHQLLALRSRSRIFQDRSAPEIARQVLEDNELDATFRLEGSYPEHDYAAQYNETDFAFLQRVLLEEGDLLLLRARRRRPRASPRRRPFCARATCGTFRFDDGNASRVEPARVVSWEKTQELTPGKVTLRDHHFALPDSPLEGTATIVPAVQAGQVTHVLRLPRRATAWSSTTTRAGTRSASTARSRAIFSSSPRRPRGPRRCAWRRRRRAPLAVAGTSTVRAFAAGAASASRARERRRRLPA